MTRAKNPMSVFMRGQGRLPSCPIPKRRTAGLESLVMGVVATMSVSGRVAAEDAGRGGGMVVGSDAVSTWEEE